MMRTNEGGRAVLREGMVRIAPEALCGWVGRASERAEVILRRVRSAAASMHAKAACRSGQGTTEYAILVGVLVVIAIVAITVFRPKIEELWNAIANGINGL